MRRLVSSYADLPLWLRKPLWRLWHNLILFWDRRSVIMTVMNYGYSYADNESGPALDVRLENERFGIQLYHETASAAAVAGKDVLEVGSGRGGGASYISRYMKPRRYVGLDISTRCINFCNAYHVQPNLTFTTGEAERISFADESFDVVISIESSRTYGDLAKFFSEVRRVLRPRGTFLLSDMRWHDRMPALRRTIEEAGFQIAQERDITKNVVKALREDSARKLQGMKGRVPRPLIPAFAEFAGVEGTERFTWFSSGAMEYWKFVLVRRE